MDVPISVLEWEVYLPEQYKVKDFGGDAILASLLGAGVGDERLGLNFNDLEHLNGYATAGGITMPIKTKSGTYDVGTGSSAAINGREKGLNHIQNLVSLLPGQVAGIVFDPQGAAIPGAQVRVTSLQTGIVRAAVTDAAGHWVVSNMTSGTVRIEASAQGFTATTYSGTPYDANHPLSYSIPLRIGTASETVEVTQAAPVMQVEQVRQADNIAEFQVNRTARNGFNWSAGDDSKRKEQAQQPASANVFNLQKKVAGILPVRVEVPRAGSSYRFARALVLDEETKLTFTYRTK
jgi:hypothetical protein